MLRRLGLLAAVIAAAAAAASVQPAGGSRYLRVGIYDEAQTLYGPVDKTFAMFKQLHVQEVRLLEHRERLAERPRGAAGLRRGRRVPVGRERARRHAGRDGRLGEVDPRDEVRRAAR